MRILLLNTYRVVNAKGGTEKVFCDMANAMAEKVMRFLPYVSMKIKDSQGSN